MYWKRHLQHVDSDKDHCRECEAGTVRFRLYTGWKHHKLLPRPISLCEIDKEKGALRLVYRVTGPKTGTESFSRLHAGAQLELLGPLGNGFPLEEAAGRKVFLMGGGIGVPPMLETMKQLDAKKIAVHIVMSCF